MRGGWVGGGGAGGAAGDGLRGMDGRGAAHVFPFASAESFSSSFSRPSARLNAIPGRSLCSDLALRTYAPSLNSSPVAKPQLRVSFDSRCGAFDLRRLTTASCTEDSLASARIASSAACGRSARRR